MPNGRGGGGAPAETHKNPTKANGRASTAAQKLRVEEREEQIVPEREFAEKLKDVKSNVHV